jgi:WD40 repeat protein/TPR repeat protein
MPTRILIVTVHGIRTFGQWQERLETVTKAAANDAGAEIVFKHKNYGYFSVLSFLNPFARRAEAERFSLELVSLLENHQDGPFDRVCLVGHSFGTHIIAHALRHLRSEISRKIDTVIFGGSVLSSRYPWSEFLGSRIIRLVNDCGTHDRILPLNAMLPFGSGVSGRNGFEGVMDDNYINRYFAFGHGGYFYKSKTRADASDDNWFLSRFWVPLLLNQVAIETSDERTRGPWSGLVAGFVARTERLKWIPPLLLLSLMVGLILFIYSLYLGEAAQRKLANFQTGEARRQTMIALRSDSTVRALLAKQHLAAGIPDRAISESLAGLPASLAAPNRPLIPDLVDALDVAVTAPSPKLMFPVSSEAYAIDREGKRLALALASGEIQLWDLVTGRQLGSLPAQRQSRVQTLELNDDGRLLVSAGGDDYVRVWDVDGLRQISSFKPDAAGILREAHFAAGATRVFSLSMDATVGLWDALTGVKIQQWHAHDGGANLFRFLSPVIDAAMSPDGEYYVTGGIDSFIKIWSARTASLYKTIQASAPIYRLSVGPKGGTLVSTDEKNLTIWSFPDGEQQGEPFQFSNLPLWLAISPDEQMVAISISQDKPYLVNIAGRKTTALPTQPGDVTSLAFTADGSQLLTASNATPDIRIWRTVGLSSHGVLRFGDLPQQRIQTTQDGDLIAWSSGAVVVWRATDIADYRRTLIGNTPENAQILRAVSGLVIDAGQTLIAGNLKNLPLGVVWDLSQPDQRPKVLRGHRGALWRLSFAENGTQLLSASMDRTAILWDGKTGALKQRFVGHDAEVQDAILLEDGKRVLTSSRDGTARVWDVESGKELVRMSGKAAFNDVVVSADNQHVIGLDDGSQVLVWQMSDGALIQKITTPTRALVGAVAVGPTNDKLIITLKSGLIIVYGLDGTEIKRLSGHSAEIKSITFSANGKRMATTGINGLVAVWQLDPLALVSTYQTETTGIWRAWLDDTGERAIVGADDSTILVWRPDTNVVIRRLQLSDLLPANYLIEWSKDRALIVGAAGLGQEIGLRTVSGDFAQTNDSGTARQMMLDYARVVSARPSESALVDQATDTDAQDADDCDRLAAQPYDPARKARGITVDKIDKTTAEAACRKAIERAPAEPRFQYQLGRILYLEKRDPEAVAAFTKAIERQYAMAKFALYQAYDEGRAGDRSEQDMLRLLREASDQGVGAATAMLADAYWSGKRLSVDRNRALELYRRAAQLDYPYAQRRLSELHETGTNVPRDDRLALYYQIQAAEVLRRLRIDDPDQILRRSALARRTDAAIIVATRRDAINGLRGAR